MRKTASLSLAAALSLLSQTRFTPLPHSVNPLVASATSSQCVDPDLALNHMILLLKSSPAQQAALQTLLAEQQNRTSPHFHQFLTPAQFAASFGVDQPDIDKVTAWLTANGFQIDGVGANHLSITFSSRASQVAAAFQTEIRQYTISGEKHYANSTSIQIPTDFLPFVQGLHLNDFVSRPLSTGLKSLTQLAGALVASASHHLVPADYAVIYNLNSLYANGLTGANQSIAILARSNVDPADVAAFRTNYGLAGGALTPLFATGTDPGVTSNGVTSNGVTSNGMTSGEVTSGEVTSGGMTGDADAVEAALDVEWTAAVAPRANIKLVVAPSSLTTDGVDLAALYAIDHNIAPVLSVSFGACEAEANNALYNMLWQQAAAQGISVIVAAGDSGVAGCDRSTGLSGTTKAVNALCSTPYNTCVGGTMFDDAANPGQHWLAGTNALLGTATGYIPENAWNESALNAGGTGLTAGGGGVSTLYGKPAWQSAPGVPADGRRDVPDVAFSSGTQTGHTILYKGAAWSIGGTSTAAPAFAGTVALLIQKYGGSQGNVNPGLYSLAAATSVFHDIVNGNNSVPGATGYQATPGYDQATGLGSLDASQLVSHWADITGGFSISASVSTVNAAPGQNGVISITVTATGGFNSPVSFDLVSVPFGVTVSFAPTTVTGSGSTNITFAVGTNAVSGTFAMTVKGSAGSLTSSVTFNLVVTVPTDCTLTATPAALTILQSRGATTKLACMNAQGTFPSNLVLSISGVPGGVTTSFAPATMVATNGSSTLTLNVSGTATPAAYTLVVYATLPNASPAFVRTVNVVLTITAPSTFTITTSASSVSFAQGAAGGFTLTSVHRGGFNGTISIATTGLPSTITATPAPALFAAPGDGTSTITLQSSSAVPTGTYTMTVLAQGGGLLVKTLISVQVTAAPAFSLRSSLAVVSLSLSNTATLTLTTSAPTNGFNLPVTFAISALPSGVTAAFSAATIAAPGMGASMLTLTTAATATTGTTTFSVIATGGNIIRSVNVQLIVTPPPTFTINASMPSYNLIAGSSFAEMISAAPVDGYTSNITLTMATVPTGMSANFSSATITGAKGTATLTIATVSTLATGVYPLTVTATDPAGNTQTAAISVTVGTVTTTLSVGTLSISPGNSATVTIIIAATSYTGSTILAVIGEPLSVTATLAPNAVAGSGASTLTLAAGNSAIPGNYTVSVRSSSAGVITTNNILLAIP
jgi:pseudomonalisin